MAAGTDKGRETVPDEELVDRYQKGIDPQGALTELYQRYGPATFAFFRRRIGTAEIAAEQNQDLYVSVLEHLGRFRGECTFRTWLFRLARNRLGQLRRRWRVHLDEQPQTVPERLWSELASPSSELPRDEDRGRIVNALKRCLARLSEIERAVVLGQYYHDVSLRALSEMLQLTNPSGARAALLAAQRRLRKCLEASGIESIASEGFA